MRVPKKFYVVWYGKTPGIYTDWPACEQQTKGVVGSRFRAFSDRQGAEAAFTQGYERFAQQKIYERFPVEKDSLCVDAACQGNPGPLEYRGVETVTGQVLFNPHFPLGTSNIGEFLALVHALAWLAEHQRPTTTIYSDSCTALQWVGNKTARTRLIKNADTAKLYEWIQRAEQWLHTHPITNPILKWPTSEWGQIPADFGRK